MAVSTYSTAIAQAAARYGVDPATIAAIMQQESSGNPTAVGPQTKYGRAVGLMQVLPSTCAPYGLDPTDPTQNLECGTAYYADMLKRYNGDPTLALAAYNAGPGNVDTYGGVPPFPETQSYVPSVQALASDFEGLFGGGSSDTSGASSSDSGGSDGSGGADNTMLWIALAIFGAAIAWEAFT